MTFFQWLQKTYGISWNEWDENYSSSEGRGKQLYNYYLQEYFPDEAEW